MVTENAPEFWRSVKLDATITLTDKLTVDQGYEAGEGFGGRMYTVNRILSVTAPDGNIHDLEWRFLELDGHDEMLWLMVKIVDDRELDIRVFAEVEAVGGDRQDSCNRTPWLFAAVDGEFIEDMDDDDFNDLDVCELAYSETFNLCLTDADGNDLDCEYAQKDLGEFTGTLADEEGQLVTLAEYYCENDKCMEPESVLLEVGHYENETGGMIRLMTGTSIRPTEIDVLT